jgi:6-phosphogluconolactonase (cycloisomerase 2 family)
VIIRRSIAVAATTLVPLALLAGFAGPASASAPAAVHSQAQAAVFHRSPTASWQQVLTGGNVFVLTNDATANSVMVFARGADGRLVQADAVATGGRGGSEVGAVVDPLASQGSLTYDSGHGLLFAVNAGSDSLSVFAVHGHHLTLRQVLPTSGDFPTSVSVSGDLAYVLNAGGAGAVTGFRIIGDNVRAIAGSTRSLGLANNPVPPFLAAPAQVAINPDRSHLVVSTKTGGTLQVFGLDHTGTPSDVPTVTASAAAVPFALTFDAQGRLQVAAASGSVANYSINTDGSLALVSGPVANGQAATCWSVVVGPYLYAANAGSATISGYRIASDGTVSLLDPSGVSAHTDAGSVDLAASPDGRYLYQEATGAGMIDEFAVGSDGTLTRIGTVAGFPIDNGSGMEGIATS